MKPSSSNRRAGFTLIELLFAGCVAGLALLAGYSLLTSALALYAKNFSLNRSHYTGRVCLEKMITKINGAGAAPILVDEHGADVAGNGPAAGVRLCTPAPNGVHSITAAVASTDTSLLLSVTSDQRRPRAGDIILINAGAVVQGGKVVQVEISAVTATANASIFQLTLRESVGSAIPAASRCLVLQQQAFITVGKDLRYYPSVMSEARHGASLFNNPTYFSVASSVTPLPGETLARPFSYTDPARRVLSVNLRNKSAAYSNRVDSFNSFFNIRSSIAVKSVYLDPSKLKAIY